MCRLIHDNDNDNDKILFPNISIHNTIIIKQILHYLLTICNNIGNGGSKKFRTYSEASPTL